MRGRGRFWLASCHRRWDIRPSSRKDSSELKERQQRTEERQQRTEERQQRTEERQQRTPRKDSSELRKDSSELRKDSSELRKDSSELKERQQRTELYCNQCFNRIKVMRIRIRLEFLSSFLPSSMTWNSWSKI
jgi:seryl-tRNA synthetase